MYSFGNEIGKVKYVLNWKWNFQGQVCSNSYQLKFKVPLGKYIHVALPKMDERMNCQGRRNGEPNFILHQTIRNKKLYRSDARPTALCNTTRVYTQFIPSPYSRQMPSTSVYKLQAA